MDLRHVFAAAQQDLASRVEPAISVNRKVTVPEGKCCVVTSLKEYDDEVELGSHQV